MSGLEPALEPDVPPDLAAERPALLVGDPPRDAARGHTARLQHDDRPRGGERRRDPRRLARARRGRHDQGAVLANARDDLGDVRIDREGREGHLGILLARPGLVDGIC